MKGNNNKNIKKMEFKKAFWRPKTQQKSHYLKKKILLLSANHSKLASIKVLSYEELWYDCFKKNKNKKFWMFYGVLLELKSGATKNIISTKKQPHPGATCNSRVKTWLKELHRRQQALAADFWKTGRYTFFPWKHQVILSSAIESMCNHCPKLHCWRKTIWSWGYCRRFGQHDFNVWSRNSRNGFAHQTKNTKQKLELLSCHHGAGGLTVYDTV